MSFKKKPPTATSRGFRGLQVLAVSAVLSVGVCGAASADSSQVDAKLAVERAQANIDLVSREDPAATHDQSFASAQQKLAEARVAMTHDDNRQATWLANEAELMADTTAGTAKLAELEHTRSDVAHDVEILQTEMNKSEQSKQ